MMLPPHMHQPTGIPWWLLQASGFARSQSIHIIESSGRPLCCSSDVLIGCVTLSCVTVQMALVVAVTSTTLFTVNCPLPNQQLGPKRSSHYFFHFLSSLKYNPCSISTMAPHGVRQGYQHTRPAWGPSRVFVVYSFITVINFWNIFIKIIIWKIHNQVLKRL